MSIKGTFIYLFYGLIVELCVLLLCLFVIQYYGNDNALTSFLVFHLPSSIVAILFHEHITSVFGDYVLALAIILQITIFAILIKLLKSYYNRKHNHGTRNAA